MLPLQQDAGLCMHFATETVKVITTYHSQCIIIFMSYSSVLSSYVNNSYITLVTSHKIRGGEHK